MDRLLKLEGQTSEFGQVKDAVAALGNDIATLRSTIDAQANQIGELDQQVNRTDGPDKMAARAVAAAALKSDIDRGIPFATSLDVMRKFMPQDESLGQLAAHAAQGIPTSAKLYEEFQALSGDILTAAEPAPESDLSSRLVAGLKSFVKVI